MAVTPLPVHATPECDLPAQLARYVGLMRGRHDVIALAAADVARVYRTTTSGRGGEAAGTVPTPAPPPVIGHTLQLAREVAALMAYVPWEEEVAWLMGVCQRLAGPVVLTHGDLQEGNWIVSDDGSDLFLIDYEYACYGHRGHDLGNLLCEHTADYSVATAPGFRLDVMAYPTGMWQQRFLESYAAEAGLGRELGPSGDAGALSTASQSAGSGIAVTGVSVATVATSGGGGGGGGGALPSASSTSSASPAGSGGSGKPPRRKSTLSRASSGSSLKALGEPIVLASAAAFTASASTSIAAPASPVGVVWAPEPPLLDLATTMWVRTSATEAAIAASMPGASPSVRRLAAEARVGMLASHLYWSLWSAVMACGKPPLGVMAVDAAHTWLECGGGGGGGGGEVDGSACGQGSGAGVGGSGDVGVTAVMSGHSVFSYAAYGLARAGEFVRLKSQLVRDGLAGM